MYHLPICLETMEFEKLRVRPKLARRLNDDRIAFLLQSDPNLAPSIANALALLIKAAYRDFFK
jgi:hypothetical protein